MLSENNYAMIIVYFALISLQVVGVVVYFNIRQSTLHANNVKLTCHSFSEGLFIR